MSYENCDKNNNNAIFLLIKKRIFYLDDSTNLQRRYYNDPRGLILDIPESCYKDCEVKVQIDEILEHTKSLQSSKVFIYPCAGYENTSKKEIEGYLKEKVPNLDRNLKLIYSQVNKLNRENVICFVCVFVNENYADFFIECLNDSNVCRATGHLIQFD